MQPKLIRAPKPLKVRWSREIKFDITLGSKDSRMSLVRMPIVGGSIVSSTSSYIEFHIVVTSPGVVNHLGDAVHVVGDAFEAIKTIFACVNPFNAFLIDKTPLTVANFASDSRFDQV